MKEYMNFKKNFKYLLALCIFFLQADDYNFFLKDALCPSNTIFNKIFFVPRDGLLLEKIITSLCHAEKKAIEASQYRLTHAGIAQALAQAHTKGISISLITDYSSFNDPYQKIAVLQKAGVKNIFSYQKAGSLMHHKFFIFHENFFNKPIVCFGSANSTYGGFRKNQEYVCISNDPGIVAAFKQEFTNLKKSIVTKKNSVKIINFLMRCIKK